MIVLDASVVIAHLSPRDSHHSAATSLLRDPLAMQPTMHPINLTEVLVQGVRSGSADRMLADLRAIGITTCVVDNDEPIRLATLRLQTGLKIPDCCALDTAATSGAELATADLRLARAARTCGVETIVL